MYRLHDVLDILLRNHGISAEETEVLSLKGMAHGCLQDDTGNRPSQPSQNLFAFRLWWVFAYQESVERREASRAIASQASHVVVVSKPPSSKYRSRLMR